MGLRRNIQQHVKGSSLVEVLVALAICAMVFTIGGMVWLNLNSAVSPQQSQRMQWISRELISAVEFSGNMSSSPVERDGLRFLRDIRPVDESTGLYQVKITCVSPSGETQFERSKIVKVYED